MWREYIESLGVIVEFEDPASVDDIAEAERKLGVSLPDELSSLLLEASGVCYAMLMYDDSDELAYVNLISSLSDMIDDNLERRSYDTDEYPEHKPFSSLLFFATWLNGDYLAYPVVDGKAVEGQFVLVSHEDWSWKEWPSSLREHIAGMLEVARKYQPGRGAE
jgi:hypothetical protein